MNDLERGQKAVRGSFKELDSLMGVDLHINVLINE